jgi:hypothetical protein
VLAREGHKAAVCVSVHQLHSWPSRPVEIGYCNRLAVKGGGDRSRPALRQPRSWRRAGSETYLTQEPYFGADRSNVCFPCRSANVSYLTERRQWPGSVIGPLNSERPLHHAAQPEYCSAEGVPSVSFDTPSAGDPHQKSRGCILRLFRLRLHSVMISFTNSVADLARMASGLQTCSIRPIDSTSQHS